MFQIVRIKTMSVTVCFLHFIPLFIVRVLFLNDFNKFELLPNAIKIKSNSLDFDQQSFYIKNYCEMHTMASTYWNVYCFGLGPSEQEFHVKKSTM